MRMSNLECCNGVPPHHATGCKYHPDYSDTQRENQHYLTEDELSRRMARNALTDWTIDAARSELVEHIRVQHEELTELRESFDAIIVWAARYAHGRSTYAPGDVRRAVATRRRYEPDWKPTGRVGLGHLLASPGALDQDDLRDLFPDEQGKPEADSFPSAPDKESELPR